MNTAVIEDKVQGFKVDQAVTAASAAKTVLVRLQAMKKASTQSEFNQLRDALRFDMNALSLYTQTL